MKAYKQCLINIYESTLDKCDLSHNDVIHGNFNMKLHKYTFQDLRDMRQNTNYNLNFKSGRQATSNALLELVTNLNSYEVTEDDLYYKPYIIHFDEKEHDILDWHYEHIENS
jgi:hypothetical protein